MDSCIPVDTTALRRERHAVFCLVLTCAVWGMGFNWNKEGQALLGERLGLVFDDPDMVSLGPGLFLAMRFVIGTLLWMAVFPRSLRGWSKLTVFGGMLAGAFLAAGMLLQHYGLASTSESLSAFLTSLCVLFTPILAVVFFRQRIGMGLWATVACATAGVALMTVFREQAGFDRGAVLGLLCAVVFSGHILAIDAIGKREDPWRFTLAQFAFGALFFSAFCILWPGGTRLMDLHRLGEVVVSRQFLIWLAVVSTIGTVLPFGMMLRYQPRTSPTRAALTYVSEPVFATTYAWLVAGRTIGGIAAVGAALIIAGNVGAELLANRRRNSASARDKPVPIIVD